MKTSCKINFPAHTQVEQVAVITRVEGVDLGQLFFTCLEEFLLKLGIVSLNCIFICNCKKTQCVRLVDLQEQQIENHLSIAQWMSEAL